MSKLNLLDLPVEILSEILSHLDHLYILRSSAVGIIPLEEGVPSPTKKNS